MRDVGSPDVLEHVPQEISVPKHPRPIPANDIIQGPEIGVIGPPHIPSYARRRHRAATVNRSDPIYCRPHRGIAN